MATKKILMLIGGKWHPWESCAAILKETVQSTGRYSVVVTEDRDALKAASLRKYAAVVVYTQGGKLTPDQEKGLTGFVEKGGAFVGLHSATAAWQSNSKYIDMIGGVFAKHGPVTEFPVNIIDKEHQITQRIPDFRVTDEFYILDKFDRDKVNVLATAIWRHQEHPVAYTKTYGKGRVFYFALGHDEQAFGHPAFRKIAVRGIDWALGRKVRKSLKVGTVGYSDLFSMGKLHLESMQKAGCEPVAVCELVERHRKRAEEEYPGVKSYRSLSQMLKHSDVELLAVITEHNTHAKLAIQCLEAGRHVVTEKPFSVTVKEADSMIAAAKKNKRMLSVFHNRRWDGDYMTLKSIIARGLIGEVFHIEACMGGYSHPGYWWRSDKRVSGGAFYDWGAHVVDWVLGLVPSPIKEISGYFQDKRVWHDVSNEDHCSATLRFANGVSAFVELSQIAAIGKPRWRVLGTLGAVETVGEEKFRVVSHKDGVRDEIMVPYLPTDWHAYHRNVCDHILLGDPLVVTPESAQRVISVIETAEKSSKAGKAIAPPRHCA
jgi:predicted dehydrogenase/type 1 glutamine amidotransferase